MAAGRDWSARVEDPQGSSAPGVLAEEGSVAMDRADLPVEDLAEGRDWRVCEALLTLHALSEYRSSPVGAHRC